MFNNKTLRQSVYLTLSTVNKGTLNTMDPTRTKTSFSIHFILLFSYSSTCPKVKHFFFSHFAWYFCDISDREENYKTWSTKNINVGEGRWKLSRKRKTYFANSMIRKRGNCLAHLIKLEMLTMLTMVLEYRHIINFSISSFFSAFCDTKVSFLCEKILRLEAAAQTIEEQNFQIRFNFKDFHKNTAALLKFPKEKLNFFILLTIETSCKARQSLVVEINVEQSFFFACFAFRCQENVTWIKFDLIFYLLNLFQHKKSNFSIPVVGNKVSPKKFCGLSC